MSDLLNQASLVMVPSGYKEDTVYSVVPSDGSGDLAFTRTSNGTRINSAGLVEVVAWNLLQYSEDFSNAVWTKKSTISLTANATTAPNGTNTATKMYANSSGTVDYGCFQILTSQSATRSVYAKKSELNYLFIGWNNDFANEGVFFNLNTGAISQNTGGYTASIESVGNGWYRCIAYFPTGSYTFISPSVSGTSFLFSNQLNNGIYIWGAQLNIGSTAKPYFPTTDRLNVPRLTYQNGGGGCPSLLLEKQSTNVVLQSEDFSSASWKKTSVTVTSNSTTAPDGNTTADTLSKSAGVDATCVQEMTATSTGYAGTIFIKQDNDETRFPEFFLRSSSASGQNEIYVQLNTKTGATATRLTIGTTSVTAPVLIGGYWRMSLYVLANSNTVRVGLRPAAGTTLGSYNANASGSIIAWGMQVESNAAYPTSYIPTTSSSATRVADFATTNNISSLFGSTEGSFFIEMTADFTNINGSIPLFLRSSVNSTFNRATYLQFGSGTITLNVYLAGALEAAIFSGSYTQGQKLKIAFAYKQNDFVLYINGSLIGTDTSGNISAGLAFIDLGTYSLAASNFQYNGKISEAVLFPTRLTNAELAQLTA